MPRGGIGTVQQGNFYFFLCFAFLFFYFSVFPLYFFGVSPCVPCPRTFNAGKLEKPRDAIGRQAGTFEKLRDAARWGWGSG
jgi:hypothetical protein